MSVEDKLAKLAEMIVVFWRFVATLFLMLVATATIYLEIAIGHRSIMGPFSMGVIGIGLLSSASTYIELIRLRESIKKE